MLSSDYPFQVNFHKQLLPIYNVRGKHVFPRNIGFFLWEGLVCLFYSVGPTDMQKSKLLLHLLNTLLDMK